MYHPEALRSFNGIISEFSISGVDHGPLQGKTFVAKDLFAVRGKRTGAGNPTWLATHEPAAKTASCIELLLAAGAKLIGKSCTDELAFSLDGINVHYGTPINPQAPDCIPGGSSSGSASAVASGIADFALGTDTAGSIRVPASYCGIYGIRPTHGRVPIDGVVPLGPSFDTVGWLARDAAILLDVGRVLLGESTSAKKPIHCKFISEGFAILDADMETKAQLKQRDLISNTFAQTSDIEFGAEVLGGWVNCFNAIRSWEAWKCHGEWIELAHPDFAPEIRDRFYACKLVLKKEMELAQTERTLIRDSILRTIGGDDVVLCTPTTAGLPPEKTEPSEALAANRKLNMTLCSIASIAGLPQVSVPVATSGQKKIGLSFIGAPGTDMMLLELALHLEQLFATESAKAAT